MTRDEIIRMAREAGFDLAGYGDWVCTPNELERFAALVRAHLLATDIHTCHDNCQRFACVQTRNSVKAEREAIAKLIEDKFYVIDEDFVIANAILARSKT